MQVTANPQFEKAIGIGARYLIPDAATFLVNALVRDMNNVLTAESIFCMMCSISSDYQNFDLNRLIRFLTFALMFQIHSWEEYCQDVALEKAAWYLESSHESNRDLAGGSTRFNQCQSLHSSPFDSLVPSSSTILEYGLLKGDKKVTW